MTHSNVIDTPRPAGGEDLLGVDNYVNALVNFISTAQMPTTLAIQGEWGSGKTSLMNQVRYSLCEMPGSPDTTMPFHGIWINTWQYALMRSPNEILYSVIAGITGEVMGIIQERHQTKLENALHTVRGMFGKIARAGAKTAASLAGVDFSAVDDLLAKEESEVGAEAFRQALAEAIQRCLEEDCKVGNMNRGFIFFIDDLDRLDPAIAVQILELLKNLFEVENCIFILAIDYEVVVKGLEPKFGPLTEKNEREFRSFFDKIIQLPFTMPVPTYNISEYLTSALFGIGYYSKDELLAAQHVNGKPLRELLSEMVMLSTGANPRSVKRLINTLSLIKIMYSVHASEMLSVQDKLLAFGAVCVQIAYPGIYTMLLHQPDFKNWDEKTARHFRLNPLDEDTLNYLETLEEFDEDWEQVVYRAGQHSVYLASRVFYVSQLLNLMARCVAADKDVAQEMAMVLGFAAVTTVVMPNAALRGGERKNYDRVRLASEEDFFAQLPEGKIPTAHVVIAKNILKNIRVILGELVSYEYTPDCISIQACNNRSHGRCVLRLSPRPRSVQVLLPPLNMRTVKVDSLDKDDDNCLPENFYADVRKAYNKLVEKKHQVNQDALEHVR